jgi:hypothetical protein
MPAVAVPFTANIPHYAQDANTGDLYLVSDIIVQAIAYVYPDGSLKGVDIEALTWKGNNVTSYVYECLPGTWDRLKEATRAFYLTTKPCPQLKKST